MVESSKNEKDPKKEEKKTCIKCGIEFPSTEEYFRKSKTKDGFEGACKECRKKYFADYRAGRRIRVGTKKGGKTERVQKMPRRSNPVSIPKEQPTITTASPVEIIVALRKGMAQEIVDMIKEKFEL